MQLPAKVMLAAARVDGKVRKNRRERRVRIQTVHAGESLWSIARRHHMNVNTLASLNGMHPGDALHAGQRIRFSTSAATAVARERLLVACELGRRVVYIVRAGDTLQPDCQAVPGIGLQILSWNGMSTGSHILKGQKLTIRVASRGG